MKVVRLPLVNVITSRRAWMRYQRRLFAWHNREFFDFSAALTPEELHFIERCIARSGDSRVIPKHLSLFTYSHKVEPTTGEVNSSRLAYGTVRAPDELRRLGAEIARLKAWPLDPSWFSDPNASFYGLGWDFAEGLDKIYFLIRDIAALPPALMRLGVDDPRSVRPGGILSWSYRGGEVAEEKLYVFPRRGPRHGAAVLCSAGRRLVQHNNHDRVGRRDLSRFSPTSRRIVQLYLDQMGTLLDTYSVDEDTGVETLYFDYHT